MAIVTMNTRIRHENSKTLFQSSEGMVLKGLRAVVVAEASRVRLGRSLHGRHRSDSCRKILGKDHVYPWSGIDHRLKSHSGDRRSRIGPKSSRQDWRKNLNHAQDDAFTEAKFSSLAFNDHGAQDRQGLKAQALDVRLRFPLGPRIKKLGGRRSTDGRYRCERLRAALPGGPSKHNLKVMIHPIE